MSNWIWIVFINFICIVITAGILGYKMQKGLLYWVGIIISFFLGPIGIIYAFLLPDGRDVKKIKRSVKKCPYCAETIKKQAIVCKHCGRDLPATAGR